VYCLKFFNVKLCKVMFLVASYGLRVASYKVSLNILPSKIKRTRNS